MKKAVINRYEINEHSQIVIDVSVQSVEQLYHDFDKRAPYYRKELDPEFVDYLSDCVKEIGKHSFIIQVSVERKPDEIVTERLIKSINSHYDYLIEMEVRSIKKVFRRSIVLFLAGVVLLISAIIVTRRLSLDRGVVAEVFAQGLTIAAWVSLWEALVNFFLEWRPHKDKIKLYKKVISSPIVFRFQ